MYVCMYICVYIYIYIYIYTPLSLYVSNTTCINHDFFRSGEYCSRFNQLYSTSNAVETNEAALDK